MRSLAPLVVVLTAVLSGAANAGNPWNLRCASMPAEQSVPAPVRAAARAFFPWTGRAGSNGLRAGPVYLLALSTRTAISRDGDDTDSSGYYLHRALIAVSPAYQGTIVLSGRRLGPAGPRTRLGFSTSGATRCTVNGAVVTCHPQPLTFQTSLRVMPGTGWRIIPTELRIGRTGCYQLQATGSGLRARIPLAVPGPTGAHPAGSHLPGLRLVSGGAAVPVVRP